MSLDSAKPLWARPNGTAVVPRALSGGIWYVMKMLFLFQSVRNGSPKLQLTAKLFRNASCDFSHYRQSSCFMARFCIRHSKAARWQILHPRLRSCFFIVEIKGCYQKTYEWLTTTTQTLFNIVLYNQPSNQIISFILSWKKALTDHWYSRPVTIKVSTTPTFLLSCNTIQLSVQLTSCSYWSVVLLWVKCDLIFDTKGLDVETLNLIV